MPELNFRSKRAARLWLVVNDGPDKQTVLIRNVRHLAQNVNGFWILTKVG